MCKIISFKARRTQIVTNYTQILWKLIMWTDATCAMMIAAGFSVEKMKVKVLGHRASSLGTYLGPTRYSTSAKMLCSTLGYS